MADIDLPYTYTDIDGDTLRVGRGAYTAYDPSSRQAVSVNTPTGEDAVALARAVLAAAGDTGYRVMHQADLIGAENAVVAMRQRAAYLVEYSPDMSRADLIEAIRALPLIPDTDDTTEAQDAQLPDRGGDVIDDIAIALTRRGDLSDEHRAFYLSVLDRFDALASELARVRDDRDRLRTAWKSARRGRADARESAGMERFFAREAETDVIRLRKELRAAREVTTATELEEWVERLDRELSSVTQTVTQRLAIVEDHLGLTDT